MSAAVSAKRDFIFANTRLLVPPLVPELRLWLADEAVPMWKKTEEELGEMGLPPPFWAFAWAGGQALARYVLDNPALVRGKRVLDFASGSGLVAIAAALAPRKRRPPTLTRSLSPRSRLTPLRIALSSRAGSKTSSEATKAGTSWSRATFRMKETWPKR